mmetsp:Transcript_94116/g.176894  ORF Transcript_94116/g.176894 Transcript_94116/m.176894 type:complete len:202 (-) Transcript_94116:41-646(-)
MAQACGTEVAPKGFQLVPPAPRRKHLVSHSQSLAYHQHHCQHPRRNAGELVQRRPLQLRAPQTVRQPELQQGMPASPQERKTLPRATRPQKRPRRCRPQLKAGPERAAGRAGTSQVLWLPCWRSPLAALSAACPPRHLHAYRSPHLQLREVWVGFQEQRGRHPVLQQCPTELHVVSPKEHPAAHERKQLLQHALLITWACS